MARHGDGLNEESGTLNVSGLTNYDISNHLQVVIVFKG